MGRRKNPVPSYLHHRPSDLAYVRVNGKPIYLGRWNSPESKAEYARICAELGASPAAAVRATADVVTVADVFTAFLEHAVSHYRRADGTATNEVREYAYLLPPAAELYGHTPAAEFGPSALKAVRAKYIEMKWARTTVNNRVRRLRHVFKWAAGEELVPESVPAALAMVAGLQAGRTAAREPEPVSPVDPAYVEATLAKLNPVVADMVRVLQLTGARPQDVCNLRPADTDTSGPVWVFKPEQHKTRHRGKVRVVAIGPRAQEILKRRWPADPEAYVFSPRKAVELRNEKRRGERKTPLYPSHVAHQQSKRKASPKRAPAERYTSHSLAGAVTRAAELAGVPAWSPNQLRHSWGTAVRAKYGLEAARVGLGHESASTSEIYAEKDLEAAKKIAGEVG